MKEFSFETLESPLFLTAAGVSLLTLWFIRAGDEVEKREEEKWNYDRVRRGWFRRSGVRVRIGSHALLDWGQLGTLRLANPAFLIPAVLYHEPLSILPVTFAWLSVLFGCPSTAAYVTVAAVAWRILYDLSCLRWLAPGQRIETILLKIVWLLATGVFLASFIYAVMAAIVVVMLVGALFFSGISKGSRR